MTLYMFRMDDICPTMAQDQFAQFERIFKQNGIRPLLGVVPDNRDANLVVDDPRIDFWKHMRSLAGEHGWTIAQHGYQHVYETRDGGLLNINRNSEFAGLPYRVQLEKLQLGAEILRNEGLDTDIFMAPSHSFDTATLAALRECGFQYVTDGYSFYPYQSNGLKFIPCQIATPRTLPFGVATVCIHANTADDSYIQRLEQFVRRHRAKILPFEAVRTMAYGGRVNLMIEAANLILRRSVRRVRKPPSSASP